jgi:sugar phosphate isomerase/epimerase
MHPRLTVLTRVFERPVPLEQDLRELGAAGVERIGLSMRKLGDGLEAVKRSGLTVTHVGQGGLIPLARPDGLDEARDSAMRSIDVAVAVGAPAVYGPPGGDPSLEWEEAAIRFVSAVEPLVAHARMREVALLIEPTIPLFADISMLHTLADTAELAERSGVGICVDVQHCWTERNLRQAIERAGPRIGLVQLSDWVPGNRHHFRAVPGDGAIPLERIVGWILETGYSGFFDLELYPETGVREVDTVVRALDRAGALLERVGA